MPETDSAVVGEQPVGAYLRGIRESRGVQLEDVAQETRIGKNYLMAIEDGQFEKLPNAAYIKGFLRLYAGYLGVPGDEVVSMYDRSTGSVAPVPGELSRPVGVEKTVAGGRGRWILPLLLLSIILVVASFLKEEEPKKPIQLPTAPRLPVAAVSKPVQPILSSAVFANDRGKEATVPVGNEQPAMSGELRPKGIVLRLKFNQDSTLNLTIDDSISQHYELKSGDLIEWKAEKSFALDLGNAGGVEAEFNGKPLQPFGASGVSAHVVLKADGTRE